MKHEVTFIPIIIRALGIATEWLLKGQEDLKIRGRVETIQATTLLRSARILRRVLETWGDLLSLWKRLLANADVKNSQEVNNNNNNNQESGNEIKLVKEQLRRSIKLFKTKLSSKNLIKK